MSSATQAEPAPAATSHIVILRAVLLALAAICLMEFWYANSRTEDYQLHSPQLSPRLWNLLLTFKLATIVAVIGIWNWHKWGLRLLSVVAIGMLFMEFYAAPSYSVSFIVYSLRIPLLLAAVWYFSQRVGNRFI